MRAIVPVGYTSEIAGSYVISYSYITSRGRISLLLHETEGEA